jgi:hypothetical protein
MNLVYRIWRVNPFSFPREVCKKGGLTKDLTPYRLRESLKAVQFVIYILSLILVVVMMRMVMKMGMSSPALIRAAISPKKYR